VRRRAPLLVALVIAASALTAAPPTSAATGSPPNAVSSIDGPVFIEGGALPGAGDSFHPESMSTESVINVDDRDRVADTSAYPNSAIGRLLFDFGGATSQCTGFLVDVDTVLTSGHCVHLGGTSSQEDWATDVSFTPGQDVNDRPFGTCGATELWTLPGWYDDQSEYQDLGVVQLDCADVGLETGWFGYFSRPGPKALNQLVTHLRGYPGDVFPSASMWTDRKRVRVTQVNMIFYRNDTFGGQSGSPIFQWGRYCAGPCAMGVHGYGIGHLPGTPHEFNNHGVRITTAREALIASIAGQNG
jgi:glutamyl endopeptidase